MQKNSVVNNNYNEGNTLIIALLVVAFFSLISIVFFVMYSMTAKYRINQIDIKEEKILLENTMYDVLLHFSEIDLLEYEVEKSYDDDLMLMITQSNDYYSIKIRVNKDTESLYLLAKVQFDTHYLYIILSWGFYYV